MADAVKLYAPLVEAVAKGGTPVIAITGLVFGGFIYNPDNAAAQGLVEVEDLFVDIVNAAEPNENATCASIPPGGYYFVPSGYSGNVSINAASDGHRFAAIFPKSVTQFPPNPITSQFPYAGPTGLLKTIKSYLYEEYNDDDDLQAFVDAYNAYTQEYLNTFNDIELPIYTNPQISGALLDWVAQGLYGMTRPYLTSGRNRNIGPFNTYVLNGNAFNTQKKVGNQTTVLVNDDIFKRCMTWNFYKGDGKQFNVLWLKRRIMRFLFGANGAPFNADNSYQISVTFGANQEVTITLLAFKRRITGGALFNSFVGNSKAFNSFTTISVKYIPLPNGEIFKEAVDTGVLQLPFQFSYVVVVQNS